MTRIVNRFGKWHSPLARRLIIALVLFSSLITLVLTSLQLYNQYRYDVGDIEANFSQIHKVHLQLLAESLWATNYKAIRVQLEGLRNVPNVNYVSVQENGQTVMELGTKTPDNNIERRYPIRHMHRGTYQAIGTLTVVASLEAVYRHLLEQAILILASNALKTFLVAGFILMFFHWLVTTHLLTITEYVRDSEPANDKEPLLLTRMPHNQPDEVDELVLAINRMQTNTRHALEALRGSEQRFHAIADYTVDWESWIGANRELLWINSSVEHITGYTPLECQTMVEYPMGLVYENDRARVGQAHSGASQMLRRDNLEYRIRHKDGSLRWVAESWQSILGSHNEFLGFRSSIRDITILKEVEHVLEQKIAALAQAQQLEHQLKVQAQQDQARMVSLLAAMSTGILFEDVNKLVLYHNPAFRRMWLIADNVDLKGRNARDVLQYSANILARPDHFSKHILQVLNTREVSDSFEIVMADGRVVTQLCYPVHDAENRFIGRLWLYEDVTRERQTAEQLIYLAERDSLTGLYNRHRFQEELSRMLAEASRHEVKGALLFFDLDEFKYINDNFGHRAGDAMLIRVAGAVGALVRRNEILARIGGDEFAVLIPNAAEDEAVHLAERVIRAVSQIPFRIENQNLRLTTSLGIALYPDHGRNTEDLIAHADASMYQAKEAGKNAWRLYRADRDSSRELLGRLTWQERIANALEKGLLRLHFQSVFRASDGVLTHKEALVRMIDEATPDEIIMPGHFISVAEMTGQVVNIDRWVVAESVRLLACHEHLPAIAVNISGRSFDDPSLAQFIADTLSTAGVAAHRLIVELTETAAVSDMHDAQRFIEALHANGSRVCLDDFGTGFASFAYLKYLGADVLKIDGLFVRDLPNDRDNQIFVKSIVDVARGLRKTTIAEFVENAETLAMLKGFGVDMVQGYHLDMPQADLRA